MEFGEIIDGIRFAVSFQARRQIVLQRRCTTLLSGGRWPHHRAVAAHYILGDISLRLFQVTMNALGLDPVFFQVYTCTLENPLVHKARGWSQEQRARAAEEAQALGYQAWEMTCDEWATLSGSEHTQLDEDFQSVLARAKPLEQMLASIDLSGYEGSRVHALAACANVIITSLKRAEDIFHDRARFILLQADARAALLQQAEAESDDLAIGVLAEMSGHTQDTYQTWWQEHLAPSSPYTRQALVRACHRLCDLLYKCVDGMESLV